MAQDNLPKEPLRPDDFFQQAGFDPSRIKMEAHYESPEERASRLSREVIETTARLEKEQRDNAHKQKIEFARFIVKEATPYALGLVMAIVLCTFSALTILDANAATESKAWARGTLTSITVAVAGYIFGKTSSGPNP